MLRGVAFRSVRPPRASSTCSCPPVPSAALQVYRQLNSSSAFDKTRCGSLFEFRSFATHAAGAADRHSVEGRYGYALFACAKKEKALDAVYNDVQGLQQTFSSCDLFANFASTPGVPAEVKEAVVRDAADKFRFNKITKNFLCLVAENKRMKDLPKIMKTFEAIYRAERGEIQCAVTSAQELTAAQKKEVIAALQKRAGPKATILADFHVSPSITGGLLVRMGDEVLDYTVATRLENLKAALMAPVNI